jgi:tRNA(Leu) C34 or U34 (ribose-2'-O)-methylase TrmL
MKKGKISIGLVNPKSPDNVASVMRAAGNFSVDGVFYTGSRYPRALRLNTRQPDMSRKVSDNIPLAEVNDILDVVSDKMEIVCIEFAENAITLPAYEHPDNVLYIFGPEDGTISQHVIDRADAVVYVPTIGCMNLAATVNVVLYDRLAKSQQDLINGVKDNDLIRQSRDTNNCLKVR